MRILIADDDAFMRRILEASLTQAGHEVLTVADGQAAWEVLEHDSVRLVITDWIMPGMDGPALIRRIRGAELPYYVYVILLTARDSKDDVVQGLEAGADDYLTKPFNPNELRARIAIGQRILDLETRLRAARDQLRELATRDSLTGLLNRRAIYEHAEAALARARREARPLGLAMLDIDHFKSVNDRFGHAVGDQALCLVADTIIRSRRPYDWVGRWGGEEFLLVLPGAGPEEAGKVAERVRAAVAAASLRLQDGGHLRLQVSVGVAGTSRATPATLDMLIQQADEALYCAKRAGRNRVCVYQDGAQKMDG